MSDPVSVALGGIGGYGNTYVSSLLDAPDQQTFKIAAAVDPNPSACRRLADLQRRQVPLFSSLEEMYRSAIAPELVVLSTPIFLHARQTCLALAHGSHVLCEKPLCSTPHEIPRMLAARNEAGREVAIGYQWSFSRAVQELKRDVLSGRFGRPRRLRTLVLWPRDETYYSRNRWAGAKRDAQGNWIGDSPVNNACAHYLHNMLYVIGAAPDRSARPKTVTAELYRAHPIENYDTAALRCRTDEGVELLFVVSHATATRAGPVFSYEFERGTVEFADGPGGAITACFSDGTTKQYGSPNDEREGKLWQTARAIRRGERTLCGIEAAAPHTQCAWAAQQSAPDIVPFPPSHVRVAGEPGRRRTSVEGLEAVLERCYHQWRLPSEMDVKWALKGRDVEVEEVIPAHPAGELRKLKKATVPAR